MGNVVDEKRFAFAVRVVKAVRIIKETKREYELANQLLRSGTSIGANISEGKYAQSDKDFVSKHKIALKEANETRYWLRLMGATNLLSEKASQSLIKDVDELIKILTSIVNTKENRMDDRANE